MPPYNSFRFFARSFASSTRRPTTIPIPMPTFNPSLPTLSSTAPKLGRIGRWYLPTMALIAAGMVYIPARLSSTTSSIATLLLESHPLDRANRTIGFAIANALEEVNIQKHILARKQAEMSQMEHNRLMLEAFGSRDSLEDMERALAMTGTAEEVVQDQHEKNKRLQDAYGEKTSWRDVQRAMEVYEVQ